MNTWELLMSLNESCSFMSRERSGKASNSELKRWCKNQAVQINGERVKWDQEVEFPIIEMVLFPKNKVTLV